MTIPSEAVRLNKSFEGFHKKRSDGQCDAYQTKLGKSKLTGKTLYDIPTCGYGTTKGVRMGMVWTEEYATQRMMEDLAEAASFVDQMVKVPINENERGALILFTNNCGSGNLAKLIKPLNKGDRVATAKKFNEFTLAQGIRMPGLVSRRAREAALFLKPMEQPSEPIMPQCVAPPANPVTVPATVTAGAAGAATLVQQGLIPAPPADLIANLSGWQMGADVVKGFVSSEMLLLTLVGIGAYWVVCYLVPRWAEGKTNA